MDAATNRAAVRAANQPVPAVNHPTVQRPFSVGGGLKSRMRLGRDYYRRYYFDPRTAVATRAEMRARARLIAALTTHAGLPVRRILEAGCGFSGRLLHGEAVALGTVMAFEFSASKGFCSAADAAQFIELRCRGPSILLAARALFDSTG